MLGPEDEELDDENDDNLMAFRVVQESVAEKPAESNDTDDGD
ncbi:MAG: hypothetical protein ACXVJW_04000 [Acidimicrobiia bacterium]